MVEAVSGFFGELRKYRLLQIEISRKDHYKLQMICDELNDRVRSEYEITPEMLGRRVLETFIREAYDESTKKLVKLLIDDLTK